MNHYDHSLFFYNGSTTGIPSTKGQFYTDLSKKMLEFALRRGVSLNDQRDTFKKQLDLIEETIHRECAGGRVTDAILERTCSKCGYSCVEVLAHAWNIQISSLLHLKAIPNDNNNGILRIIK